MDHIGESLSVAECEEHLAKALQDERLSALWAGIRAHDASAPLGCGPSIKVNVRECGTLGPEGTARAFLEAPPVAMVLCANRLHSFFEVKESLRHEMVHAYDMCAAKLDLTRCFELAYSEVRAAREAECRHLGGAAPLGLGFFKGWNDSCVRRKATRATEALFPADGAGCVADAFRAAMRDLSPQPGAPVEVVALATTPRAHPPARLGAAAERSGGTPPMHAPAAEAEPRKPRAATATSSAWAPGRDFPRSARSFRAFPPSR